MGPKNACSYADIAMWEIDRLAKLNDNIKPNFWWRYIPWWYHRFLDLESKSDLDNPVLFPKKKAGRPRKTQTSSSDLGEEIRQN
jgi:hypothetical protein